MRLSRRRLGGAVLGILAAAVALGACGSSSKHDDHRDDGDDPGERPARHGQAGGHDRRQELPRGAHPRPALRPGAQAKGFTVNLKENIGSSEVDRQGAHERADRHVPRVHGHDPLGRRRPDQAPPKSAADAYTAAKAFE